MSDRTECPDEEGPKVSERLKAERIQESLEAKRGARTGRLLGPSDIVALLAPAAPTEDQRALLSRAAGAGYRVEAQ